MKRVLLGMIAVLAGCVSDGPAPPVRRAPGPQPDNALPSHLVVNINDFVDTDQNGYLDTGTATVYIFADAYALPLNTAGSFVFTIEDPAGAPLGEWVITPEQADGCRIRTQVGPGYGFSLDLRQAGAEKTGGRDAILFGSFTDASGRTIRSGRLSVTIGQAR